MRSFKRKTPVRVKPCLRGNYDALPFEYREH